MSEFLRYVLWELRRYSVLILVACAFTLTGFAIFRGIYQRRHGGAMKLPWKRVLLFLVFIGYLALIIFVTNFRSSGMYRQVNFHLFRGWREALNNFSQHRWLNVLLNIAMFCPFGFLLPLLSRKFQKWYFTVPAGLAFSLIIELLQLIFARGVFDVDDLCCNTLGGLIGYSFVMVFLSLRKEKGKRWKSALCHACMTGLVFSAVGCVFLHYHIKEFGNLPQAPAYRVDTRGTVWNLECALPQLSASAAVYQIQTRSIQDCDAFAENFKRIIPTEFEDISYYQEAAYYMDHGSGDGAHFLFVHYLDQGYEYTAIYDDIPQWGDADQETLRKALEKYPLQIPETAEFHAEGDGWHSFTVNQEMCDGFLCDGILRVRYARDGTVREIQNGLLSYAFYRDAAVISPEEALNRLLEGKFNDEGYFEYTNPAQLSVLACIPEYRVDTKGFYQPVYVFEVRSDAGDYGCRIVIPALK